MSAWKGTVGAQMSAEQHGEPDARAILWRRVDHVTAVVDGNSASSVGEDASKRREIHYKDSKEALFSCGTPPRLLDSCTALSDYLALSNRHDLCWADRSTLFLAGRLAAVDGVETCLGK